MVVRGEITSYLIIGLIFNGGGISLSLSSSNKMLIIVPSTISIAVS